MRKRILHFVLYLLPLVVVLLQMYFSQFSTLNRWKGGGFGMYSSPHPDDRTIYLETKTNQKATFKKIYPFNLGLPDSSLAGLESLYPSIPKLLVFPSLFNASEKDRIAVKKWAAGKAEIKSSQYQISIVVTERKWNLQTRSFSNYTISRHEL